MKRILRSLALLCGLAAYSSCFAWIDTGHMMIAAIAEDRLTDKVYTECEKLLAVGGTDRTKDFASASCWADDTKTKENGPWHYIDIPYRMDGKPAQTKPADENVAWAISHFSDVLKDKNKPVGERADALRYLIHFVGDIHQPLHAVTLESADHPDGDRGGNEFAVKTGDMFTSMEHPPTNLHFLWDMGVGLFMPGQFARPLDAETKAKLHLAALDLAAKYPEKSFGELTKDMDPMDWAKESNRCAQEYAYKVRTGGEIDLSYQVIAKTICGQRAVLAGYRLASLLNKLLG